MWRTRLGRTWMPGCSTTRTAAMNRIDRPYRYGYGEVANLVSGERWARKTGSWFVLDRPFRAEERQELRNRLHEAVPVEHVYAARGG